MHVDLLSYAELDLWLGVCKGVEETNKEEKSWWTYPHTGVNHVYPVLMCFLQFYLCCLCIYFLNLDA